MRYQVTAYDKDDGVYEILYECSDLAVATSVAKAFEKYTKEDRLLTAERQPYDWIEIYSVDEDDYCELVVTVDEILGYKK